MDGILQELYDLPCTYIFVAMVAISFDLHIKFLKKWFDNRANSGQCSEIIQSLQTSNEKLVI